MPDVHKTVESKIPYPGQDVIRQLTNDSPPELAEEMRSFLVAATGRQMLIQPEIHSQLSFADQVPLPTIMIWTPEQVARKTIVPPSLDLPATSKVKPSLAMPNQETQPTDISLTSTDLSPRSEAMPAGTTAPVNDRFDRSARAAASLRTSLEEATPAAVLSISEFRIPDSTLLLPPVNDVAAAAGGSGAEGNLSPQAEGAKRGEADDITVDGRRLSAEHIVLPENGRFNVVVVGSSLAEQYPETASIWANRVAYTAYLHVGLRKNWILQYSGTRAAEVADAGQAGRMNAPWPYDMLRPNLSSRDMHAKPLMVHGILNQAGRLESLAIAFPSSFRYASFVLRTLSQWQFRPAQLNGQATAVEVLLIIPDELD
jgi:hypothetical protein